VSPKRHDGQNSKKRRCVSWGPTEWVLLGEIFDNRIRAYALAVAAAAQWIADYIVSQTFRALTGVSLGLAYGIDTLMAAVARVRDGEGSARALELEGG
jgi:hypothetical protein